MELRIVNIDDVYPDENNPRENFDGIKELADSFDLNHERPGEPFTPILVVQDGGIYRIVDGERRYKALLMRKTKRFTATVCDDIDEANTMAAMLATNDKQPLSKLELSRGVQQMLLLGVDPKDVEVASKIKGADRIKRSLLVAKDYAQDMTLDRLLAIEEFADDPDMVEQLSTCEERVWPRIVDCRRADIKREADLKAITDALIEIGVEIIDEVDCKTHSYDALLSSAESVRDKYGDHAPEGTVATTSCYRASATTYVPRSDSADAPSPEEQARQRQIDEMVVALETVYRTRLNFVASKIGEVAIIDLIPVLQSMEVSRDDLKAITDAVDEFNEFTGKNVQIVINGAMFVYLLSRGLRLPHDRSDVSNLTSGYFYRYLKTYAADFLALTKELIALGYEQTPDDKAVEQMYIDFLACENQDI